jgi:hypothetical protein
LATSTEKIPIIVSSNQPGEIAPSRAAAVVPRKIAEAEASETLGSARRQIPRRNECPRAVATTVAVLMIFPSR